MKPGTKSKIKKNVNILSSEEKKVQIWKKRIDIGKDFAKKNFTEKAERWRKFYKGEHFPSIAEQRDRVVINYTYSIIKSIIPQSYYRDPYLKLIAGKKKYKDSRQIAEDVLNFNWQAIKIKRQMKRILLDMLIMGYGAGKLGYFTDTVKNQNMETNAEYTFLVKDEYPYFLRQSPFDMVFDIEAKHFDDIRWLAVRYYVPYEDIKVRESIKYNHTDDIEGKYLMGIEYADKAARSNSEIDNDLKRVELWEIQDLVDGRILTVSDEVDDFLRDVENPYPVEGSNYKLLYTNEVPDEIYPMSEITNLEQLNKEYDRLRTQILNHLRSSQRKILYERGVFTTDAQRDKFLDENDLSPVEVIDGGKDKIWIVQATTPDANLYNGCDAMLFDMNNVTRVGFNQRATESNVEKTATEANIIEKNANLGNAERLDYMTDYSVDIARDLLAILQKFSSKKQEIYIKRTEDWLEWKKEDIAGDYSVKIDIDSMTKEDPDRERAKAMELFGTLVNLTEVDPQTGQERLLINRRVLAKGLMEKYGLSEDEIKEILETPPPVQLQQGQANPQAQQQIAQLLAQGGQAL